MTKGVDSASGRCFNFVSLRQRLGSWALRILSWGSRSDDGDTQQLWTAGDRG